MVYDTITQTVKKEVQFFMPIKSIRLFSILLILFSTFLVASSGYLFFFSKQELIQEPPHVVVRTLPSSPFSFNEEKLLALGENILELKNAPLKRHLPDLRAHLVFSGKNSRPDAHFGDLKIQLSIQNGKVLKSVSPKEKVYLAFDKNLSPCKYTFAKEGETTPFWLVPELNGNEVKITLSMVDHDGNVVTEDDPLSHFTLVEKDATRQTPPQNFELSSPKSQWRVDGTLLARQKARWMGVDKFLEKHGGEEFLNVLGKHRIDFGEGDETYSVFVGNSDTLIWDKDLGRWIEKAPCKESVGKPLLVVKRVEDRVMMLELYEPEGKSKVTLNLIRAQEGFSPDHLASEFRFVGARTKSQVVFEIDQKRFMVKPNDWLVMTKEGWRKLKTPQEIDDYVSRRLVGTLFVFEEIGKKEDKPVLIGHMFNPSRTDSQTVEIAMTTSSKAEQSLKKEGENVEGERLRELKQEPLTPVAKHF